MDLIETLEPVDFKNYLKEFDNTICGRHPISVLLNVTNILFSVYILFDKIFNWNYLSW